ncbi:tryptophan synthase subunit alpha [Candidatus Desantisbacteria bacterium CG02_land_8_20_14_3_00_49_13]|nr:MAG: tryptophan synthase subunit alpha [Candidatus Desantisbacteria bacterium CG1_02_49_89]PIV55460.1 MAG: tryptophan synthase subunit alpha [Candidatus Desantisbacteria bacterium CG02_land_8_20_14_3_00_49_13]PJB27490.1 MAG: tryptophan synthase subunit alpha [Candidatus Desantisbacteria bacterium CG_4_9_14_3_um_filter_50_7]
MNRIEEKFRQLKRNGKKAFIPYITCGFPDLRTTEKLIPAMEKAGADIIELGVPFSDPIADGPVIQFSSQEALKKKVNLRKILKMVSGLRRRRTQVPVVLMGYYNSICAYGEKKFLRDAAKAGIDGLIIADLPADEGKAFSRQAAERGIDVIFLAAPTSGAQRLKKIARLSRGYVYYVSLTGVTGARKELPPGLREKIRSVCRLTSTPVCVGFGISKPGHIRSLEDAGDGIIVGSAIINIMKKNAGRRRRDLVRKTAEFVGKLAGALTGACGER